MTPYDILACECNDHGRVCDRRTGTCQCSTKGIVGDYCDKCDTANHYTGDPTDGGTCYCKLSFTNESLLREISIKGKK